ncbi:MULTISPECIES: cold-shock protein [Photobacterium]|jgi:CspA family cold shock protein|uniref:Cold-shock protein n=1 Tax=Photobacterium carnosum TaxID=2023717 RepID=A0A2N4UNG5_9GAMM|nr:MULTISPECIES: cold-shock protein [Photobacterium]KAE8176231.1 cold-shock protein [Photobacterium carnosum]MBY3789092.1 cold-shock protein [Photobacterium carnosum]MCD9467419.1 cold-shock protein [Photobacterium iliopiscarium]MCD9487810.1 cold-shock protein [Photobacterium iliopiscarium]MCD9495940.1 cold-shock protein [Photobacterium carnosum]
MSHKATGLVKWFSEEKGFGFLTQDTGNADVFVHSSGIADKTLTKLPEGKKVSFDVEHGQKGLQAINVVVL